MSISFYIATADSTATSMDYDRALPENDDEHQLNLTNTNAKNLLRAVGLEYDPEEACGCVLAKDVPALRRDTVRALNTREGRSALVREPYTSGGENTARLIEFGTDDDYATRTLARFLRFLARASELGRHIYWG